MQILLALVPLVLFYVIERVYGPAAGVILAIVFVLGDLGWRWIRQRRVDRTILGMGALVIVLGGLSLASDDERFFLISPVVGDLVFAVILVVANLRGRPLLVSLAASAQPDEPLDAEQRAYLYSLSWRLAANFVLHAAWTAWSVGESRETWLFVSGPGQYMLLGAQVGAELLWARLHPLPPLPPAFEDDVALALGEADAAATDQRRPASDARRLGQPGGPGATPSSAGGARDSGPE